VLENGASRVHAAPRCLGEVVGFGNCVSSRLRRPRSWCTRPTKRSSVRVRAALLDASLEPSAIDLVLCAESGVNRMDMAEEEGLARVLGSDVATLATKALWGETFGAAAALSTAAALTWFAGEKPAALCCAASCFRPVRTALIIGDGLLRQRLGDSS